MGAHIFLDDGNDHSVDDCYELLSNLSMRIDTLLNPPPVADIVVLLSDAPDRTAASCVAVAEWLRQLTPSIRVAMEP